MSNDNPETFFAFVFGGGLVGYWHGLNQIVLKRAIQFSPLSRAVGVAPGIAEVCGKAKRLNETYRSPLDQTECVYYCTRIYAWRGSGKSRRRNLVSTLEPPDPILVEDDTGAVLVKPEFHLHGSATDNLIDRSDKQSEVPERGAVGVGLFGHKAHGTEDQVYRLLSTQLPRYANYNDLIDVEETRIVEGDPIYCIGTAAECEMPNGGPRMMISYDASRRVYCIGEGSQRSALSAVSLRAIIASWGGPLLAVLGLVCFLAYLEVPSDRLRLAALIPLALMYGWLVISGLFAAYNGMIALKVGTDRAAANIDAMLAKRAALIPELVGVVKGYAAHEAQTLTALAAERASAFSKGASTVAIQLERYPELKADKQFALLAAEITALENQLAASRQYYNDAVELYNRRIGVFPFNVLARCAGLTPRNYLA
jgi:LemA protein